jgi:predicted phosphodiesterase
MDGSTWHTGPCGVCGNVDGVTSPDEFGLLGNDWNLKLPDENAYDVVVLAGDIHVGVKALYWAAKTFSKPVIFVPGNHEYYGNMLQRIGVEMRACARELGIHYLDNDVIEMDGVRVIGSTLWTDFELFGSGKAEIGKALHSAKNGISDFNGTIIYGTTGWFRPEQSVTLHRVARQFIVNELAKPFQGKTCVITHHLPSMRSVSPRFAADVLSAAFASNLDDLVEQADIWIHGHTHDSFDYALGKCRVVCNPRGYPTNRMRNSYENCEFDAAKIVVVGSPAPAHGKGMVP